MQLLEKLQTAIKTLHAKYEGRPLGKLAFAAFMVVAGLMTMVLSLAFISAILLMMAFWPFFVVFFLVSYGVAMLVLKYKKSKGSLQKSQKL